MAGMEQWRQMAEMVSGQTITRINMTTGIVESINSALMKLAICADVLRRSRAGLAINVADAPPIGVGAGELLSRAIADLTSLGAIHSGSVYAFVICATHIGLPDIAPWWWQRWEGHAADVATHTDTALRSLLAAASHAEAARLSMVRVCRSVPWGSPLWAAWLSATEQLVYRTAVEAVRARAEVKRMRPAIVVEFFDVRTLLSV